MTASLPRPVLLAIIGTVLFAGLFVFTRSRSSDSSSSSSGAAATAPAPAPSTGAGSSSKAGSSSATAAPKNGTAGGTKAKPASEEGLPASVSKALGAKKTVVLLFWNGNAVDDRSVHQSVARLSREGGKVAVFDDSVKNLARYTRITATAQVTQTPSIVIVDRRGAAQVKTGYYDFETIDQFVDTARRR